MNDKLCHSEKNKKFLVLVFCCIFILIGCLTVVYATLNVYLAINGSTEITAANWNIGLTSNSSSTSKTGSVTYTAPTISGSKVYNYSSSEI